MKETLCGNNYKLRGKGLITREDMVFCTFEIRKLVQPGI